MKKNATPQRVRLFKNLYGLLILLFISMSGFSQNVGINSTGAIPNASAGLDVDFMNMGLLIPRIALTGTANAAPLTAKVAGMIVYNTAVVADVTPGFYYNDGTNWIAGFPTGSSIGDMLYWNGTAWVKIPVGTSGQFLQLSASNVPIWAGVANASITTNPITTFTAITATAGGNITSDNGSPVLSRGVCFATTANPTTGNSLVVASPATGIGSFACNLTGLTRATPYYVRAYATNNSVTTYALQQTFTTLAVVPVLATTTAATVITATSAICGGNVTDDGGSALLERGICYAASPTSTPLITNTKVVDPLKTTGSYISNIAGLSSGTTYYVRSYATNGIGTNYGGVISFMTLPSVTSTTSANSITATSVSTGGVLAPFQALYNVYYYGVAYSTTSNAASPTKVQTGQYPAITGLTFVQSLTGLTSNTLYYIRAYATTSSGTVVYGPELSFTTSAPTAPVVTTTALSSITPTSVLSGYTVVSDGGSTITAKGVCWGTSSGTVLGTNNFTNDAFTVSSITNLTPSTTYFVRAYATNGVGTAYGNELTFSTCGNPIYSIGQSVAGGIVYYVDCTGQHGLIVSTVDFGSNVAPWGCSGTLMGASGTAIYTGLANTNAILAGCATAGIAARLCASYTAGGLNLPGYTNWYLPSIDELKLMYSSGLVTPPSSVYTYWSSTEGSATVATGWFFYNNYQMSAVKSSGNQMVSRAVRAF